ncbi:MAG TPA: isoprenoid biosynthesis glyoxalase ElbB [Prolixibacteraceae bacterium]|nr:isoprenoid biosynthesis glyoxalase ElbB [Prolixibacteraceae bacterium]
MNPKKIAVILAGCGVYDGSEIHEAVATLLAIEKSGVNYQIFAPDINQFHVIDHVTGEVSAETRNVFVESARIARGNIKKLRTFEAKEFDAIVFPGGFGVAKNLCTYAIDGPDNLVNPLVEKAIRDSIELKKPIGALCISPVLLATVLGNITVTIGSNKDTIDAINSLDAKHITTKGSEVIVDTINKIVSTPCYMLDAPISVIFEGAANVINKLIELMD